MKNPFHRPLSAFWLASSAIALIVAVILPAVLLPFHLRVLQQIFLFGGMAIAWGFLGGFTTYWSFGHTAFIGLGAFSSALFEQWLGPAIAPELRLACGLLIAVVITFAVAILIALPILKLRGVYFAIGMLAFAEILGEASRNFDIFQGAIGVSLPAVSLPGVSSVSLFYWLFLMLFVVNSLIFIALRRSRIGMGLICIGQDEDTANMLGVPAERHKRIAFVLSACMISIGGVLYAHSLGFITTGSVFRVEHSLDMIVFNMLGGIGTVIGPALGTAIMVFVTQIVLGRLLDYHLMLTGVILIAIVSLAPAGLIGLVESRYRRRRSTQIGTAL